MNFERAESTHARGLWRAVAGCWAVLAALAAGCHTGSERCDVHQVVSKNEGNGAEYCVCAVDAVPDSRGYGCTPCGPNEHVDQGKCACSDGYERPAADAGCEQVTGQPIGAACDADNACSEPYPFCVGEGDDRYCTKQGCVPGACPAGYTCDGSGDSAFCARLPSGLGAPCTAGGNECSGFEASYCESFMAHSCFVDACASGQNRCPGEYACCDLGGLVGEPLSLCLAPSQLSAGMCPGGMVMP